MSRKKLFKKREKVSDPIFGDFLVTKFINVIMRDGKKSIAEGVFYDALDKIQEKTGQSGIETFKKAIDNVKPLLEVKSRRVGGATYQVPIDVNQSRSEALASRWIIESARDRGEHSMEDRLAAEIVDASQLRGSSIKKREDIHRMAEANRAFSHFRW